jgi:hypothetical protein
MAAMAIGLAAAALVQAQEMPPKTHMTIARPAELKGARAEAIYQAIRSALQENYAVSGDPIVFEYRNWRRFNTVPYRSTNHGERFVNNYANRPAGKYGLFEKAGEMPEGAVVVKDSFTVSDSGQVMTGPFFLMQKMEPGFNRASGDWMFMMIKPDGKITGITGGMGKENVAFCAQCHQKAAAGHDGLYFLPQQVRRRN